MDESRLNGYKDLLNTAQTDLTTTLSQRGLVGKKQVQAAEAVKCIEQTVQAAQRYCKNAIAQVGQLERKEATLMSISTSFSELENSVESFKGQRILPTITEMSKILLSVIQAINHYTEHEPEVKAVSRRMFALINRYVKWPSLIEEEEDEALEKKYNRVVDDLAGS